MSIALQVKFFQSYIKKEKYRVCKVVRQTEENTEEKLRSAKTHLKK